MVISDEMQLALPEMSKIAKAEIENVFPAQLNVVYEVGFKKIWICLFGKWFSGAFCRNGLEDERLQLIVLLFDEQVIGKHQT